MVAGSVMKARDFHLGSARRAGQGVHFIDPVDELGPALAQSTSRRQRLGRFSSATLGPVRGPDAIRVGAIEMDEVLVGFRDVDENSGQKLERVEQGIVVELVPGSGFVDEEPGTLIEAQPRQVDGCPHEITRELVESFGVGGIDGGVIVNAADKPHHHVGL